MKTEQIIAINIERTNELNAPYDPIKGGGTSIERFEFAPDGMPHIPLYLPVAMKETPLVRCLQDTGSVIAASKVLQFSIAELINAFQAVRCCYDFEFWAATCVKIKGKKNCEEAFILNYPQRILLKDFERQRLAGVPIRNILLKHRQWGGSTLTQMYIAWIQLFLKKGLTALIVGNMKDQSKHILHMYTKMLNSHGQEIFRTLYGFSSLALTPYAESSNFKTIIERSAVLGLGSVQEPEALRSHTVHLLHLSEVGTWKSTPSVNAEDLAQNLYGSLVDEPLTFCVKESTAQGVNNYFHKEWQRAVKKQSNDTPVFIEWFRDAQYMKDPRSLDHITSTDGFIKTWDEYEHTLFTMGATIEHIAWRRSKKNDYPELWRFQQEFPSTPDEAFTSTSRKCFQQEYVNRARRMCIPPIATGELFANSPRGKESLKNIQFEKNVSGKLSIWSYPNLLGVEKPNKKYTNRYCAFADIGGTTEKADYSCIVILDRIMTLFGGVPFVAAEFHAHIDPDLFAWYGARLCRWYNNAYFAIEVNSLSSDKGDNERGYSPDHSFTVMDEIKEFYDNLFYRVRPQQMQDKWDGVIGFHTNKQTKPMIISALNAALREDLYEERSIDACDEFEMYEIKPDGTLGATDGNHDDRVITRSGAIWISNGMDQVKEYDIPSPPPKPRVFSKSCPWQ